MKMSKEEAEAYDKDPATHKKLQIIDSDSSDSEYVDIDEFEYDEDGHAIFPFWTDPLTNLVARVFTLG